MSPLHWVLIILAGLILLDVVLAVLGVGGFFTWLATAVYHLFKPEEPPGENDDNWQPDQGRDVD